MRLNLLITCIAIAAVTIFTTFFISEAWKGNRPETTSLPSPNQSKSIAADEDSDGYVLRECDGKLAVFSENSDSPTMVFDVYVSTLPPFDRGQLSQGIFIPTYEELLVRIEDYIS